MLIFNFIIGSYIYYHGYIIYPTNVDNNTIILLLLKNKSRNVDLDF